MHSKKEEKNNSLKIKRDETLSKMLIDFNKVILALAVITPILNTGNWRTAIAGMVAIIVLTFMSYYLIKEEKNGAQS